MLRKYSPETGKTWDEGVPVQESLGFSPAELVFGHSPCSPFKVLRYDLSFELSMTTNVLDYGSQFCKRLHKANAIANKFLAATQNVMKRQYDRPAVTRHFQVGDKVLALLPIPGSTL